MYADLINFIKQIAAADPLINTITQGEDLDLNKMNVFPLFNINVTGAGFTNGSVVTFDLELAALTKRDINNEPVEDKFWLQDNEVDNLSEMLMVLNRLWTLLYNNFCNYDITTQENPGLNKIVFEGENILDGWVLNTTIEYPNNAINLCQECEATETPEPPPPSDTITVNVVIGATDSNCTINFRDTATLTVYSVQLTNGTGEMPPDAPINTTYDFITLQTCINSPSFASPQSPGDTTFELVLSWVE